MLLKTGILSWKATDKEFWRQVRSGKWDAEIEKFQWNKYNEKQIKGWKWNLYLVYFIYSHLRSSWNEFYLLHNAKDISLHAESQVKTKVADVIVQEPLHQTRELNCETGLQFGDFCRSFLNPFHPYLHMHACMNMQNFQLICCLYCINTWRFFAYSGSIEATSW